MFKAGAKPGSVHSVNASLCHTYLPSDEPLRRSKTPAAAGRPSSTPAHRAGTC